MMMVIMEVGENENDDDGSMMNGHQYWWSTLNGTICFVAICLQSVNVVSSNRPTIDSGVDDDDCDDYYDFSLPPYDDVVVPYDLSTLIDH